MTDSDKEVLYAWERDRIFSEDYKGTFDSIKECIEAVSYTHLLFLFIKY